jgi:hypothetical protein
MVLIPRRRKAINFKHQYKIRALNAAPHGFAAEARKRENWLRKTAVSENIYSM